MSNETKEKINYLKELGPYFAALLALAGVIVSGIMSSSDHQSTVDHIDGTMIPMLESKFNDLSIKVAKLEAYVEMLKIGASATASMHFAAEQPAPDKLNIPRMRMVKTE